ncbi:MAG: hypothetical protein QM758_04770 [Armatimonas sp.]
MNPLSLTDLDPKLAEALKPLLLRIPRTTSANPFEPNPQDPPAEWRAATEQARVLGPLRSRALMWQGALVGAAFPLGTIAPLFFLAVILMDSLSGGRVRFIPFHPALTIFATAAWVALCWWYILFTQRQIQKAVLRHYFTPEILQALRPLLTLSPLESEYLDAVGALLKAGSSLGGTVAGDLFASLNELLTAGRRLEREQATLSEAQAGQSIAQIQMEQVSLQEKMASTTDGMARETIAESLALCERRLERARQLAPLQERVGAQLGGITQTMRSVQASVAALRLAPGGADLQALQESARGLIQRTQAMEGAVQEVLHIGR